MSDQFIDVENSFAVGGSLRFDDEEEEETTPAQVLAEMKVAWENEVAAAALLPHKFDAVECLIDQIEGMEENVAKCNDKTQVKISIHRMELQRITYLINDYLRVRLAKIENNPRWMIREHEKKIREHVPTANQEAPVELLAPQELEFAKKYAENEAMLMGNTVLGRLPVSFQHIPVPVQDNENERVFCKTLEENLEHVTVPDYNDRTSDLVIPLEKGATYIIPFNSIEEHLQQGGVRLL